MSPFGYHVVSLALLGMIGVALFVVTRMLLIAPLPVRWSRKSPL